MRKARPLFYVCFALLAAPLLAACGGSDDTSDDDDGGSDLPAPEQACIDTADALASSAQRCGFDYQANFDAFVKAAANGDCGNIVSIRDESSLRGDCIPFFKNLTCEEIDDPNLVLPPSCQDQLIRLN